MTYRRLHRFHRPAPVIIAVSMVAWLAGLVIPSPAGASVPADQVYIPVTGSPLTGIQTSPGTLTPGFSPSVHDYVVRCQAGVNALAIHALRGGADSGRVPERDNPEPSGALGRERSRRRAGGRSRQSLGAADRVLDSMPAARLSPAEGDHPWDRPARLVPHRQCHIVGDELALRDGPRQSGTPVWYQAAPGEAIDVEALPNDTIAWSPSQGPGIGANPTGAFYTYQLDTQTAGSAGRARASHGSARAAADGQRRPDDDRQPAQESGRPVLARAPITSTSTIVDCLLEEVSPSGGLVWEWRMSDHVGVNEAKVSPMTAGVSNVNGQPAADIYHCNSVEIQPSTGDVMVSSRNTSAVYLIDKLTGHVIWKMGGTTANQDNAKILSVKNDPETGFSGQHDARFQMNGDVSLYDDHTGASGAARGVEYAINPGAATATLAWEYRAPDGGNAPATGGFRRYSTNVSACPAGTPQACNDNVVGWGFKAGSGFTEVDANDNMLMNLSYPNGEQEYRVVKVPQSTFDVNILRQTAGLPRPVAPTVGFQALGGVHLEAGRGLVGPQPARRVRAGHGQPALAHLVGRNPMERVRGPRRCSDLRPCRLGMGPEPVGRVCAGHRQPALAPLVGWNAMERMGAARGLSHLEPGGGVVGQRAVGRRRGRRRRPALAPLVGRNAMERMGGARWPRQRRPGDLVVGSGEARRLHPQS